jgi:hypothetical protein
MGQIAAMTRKEKYIYPSVFRRILLNVISYLESLSFHQKPSYSDKNAKIKWNFIKMENKNP